MTLAGFVWRDLLRNPRRTIASMIGVIVGVGLFSAVLFFIDGSGASMTKRALAPLALDSQRVLTAPIGKGIQLDRRLDARSLESGDTTVVSLTVRNNGIAPAHEVVVRDRPAKKLAYVEGSMRVDEAAVNDVNGSSPLWQEPAGIGYNLGTLPPHTTRTISYRVAATSRVVAPQRVSTTSSVTSREVISPIPANAPRPESLKALAAAVGKVSGVKAADPLVFVDMATGSIAAGARSVPGPVKLFAFDATFQEHYPSIRLLRGRIDPNGVVISAEAARSLRVGVGDTVTLKLPGPGPCLTSRVTGIADLSKSRPLFFSRGAGSLEKFLYVPYTIIVPPKRYRSVVAPAFEHAAAGRSAELASLPLEELDILVDRSRLNADPASALEQSEAVSRRVLAVAPGQDYLIDNIGNTLKVARGDASVAKRMFIFLGLPGALLAALLTAYAGSLLGQSQRRENALLRVRGANQRHLLFLLGLRTLAVAGVGSLLGAALGLGSVVVLLGRDVVFAASTRGLLQSALISVGGGVLVTAIALYLPGRRMIRRDIKHDLAEQSTDGVGWLRIGLLGTALVGAVIAQIAAGRSGAFDVPAGSVYAGQSVSLPVRLLGAPIVGWLAATYLLAYLIQKLIGRAAGRSSARFGRVYAGLLWRSITRRLGALIGGVATIALVVGLGATLACFATTYDQAKGEDARFLVGSDVRLTPNPTSSFAHRISLEGDLRASGTTGTTAVVYAPENAVLTSAANEDVATLAAVDPAAYGSVAALHDSGFEQTTARAAMAKLNQHPDGILVNKVLADGLKVSTGDDVTVLLGRGTDRQIRKPMKVTGLFTQFPGAPKGTDLVANRSYYERSTGLTTADYYLIATAGHTQAGIDRATHSLESSLPDFNRRFDVQTSTTALDTDQSSLTALHVVGLLHLNSFYTFAMAATAMAMFVFGLLLQRRREYVTLRAQGLQGGVIRRLVLSEAAITAILGSMIGMIVGVAVASQFVRVLRPIFTLTPTLHMPVLQLSLLEALVIAATVLSSAAAAVLIARLKPTELLREE